MSKKRNLGITTTQMVILVGIIVVLLGGLLIRNRRENRRDAFFRGLFERRQEKMDSSPPTSAVAPSLTPSPAPPTRPYISPTDTSAPVQQTDDSNENGLYDAPKPQEEESGGEDGPACAEGSRCRSCGWSGGSWVCSWGRCINGECVL